MEAAESNHSRVVTPDGVMVALATLGLENFVPWVKAREARRLKKLPRPRPRSAPLVGGAAGKDNHPLQNAAWLALCDASKRNGWPPAAASQPLPDHSSAPPHAAVPPPPPLVMIPSPAMVPPAVPPPSAMVPPAVPPPSAMVPPAVPPPSSSPAKSYRATNQFLPSLSFGL